MQTRSPLQVRWVTQVRSQNNMQQLGNTIVSDEAYAAGCFVCPECGDTKFGSTSMEDGSLIRSCYGSTDEYGPCTFQWPNSDDHKYFHLSLQYVLTLVDRV
jgi:hypothetical protein